MQLVFAANQSLSPLNQLITGKKNPYFMIHFQFAYSEYCGFPFCKLCVLKTKPFPRNNPDFKRRGAICKICDRKFHVREFIKGQKSEIQA